MSDNKETIVKGVKFMAGALPLMFLGPFILTIGFKALKDGLYLWIVLGIIICFTSIILAFLGIRTIIKGLFEK